MQPSILTVYPPLGPAVHLRRSARGLPFPLSDDRCRIYRRARQGLVLGLHALGIEAGDEVLAPAYHHGSEVEALVTAGLTPRFYDWGGEGLPDELELERLLTPRTRVLHLIHYYGIPQDSPRWRRWCDERGLLLVEDAAQAWLSEIGGRPVGSFGDLAIFCLYKTFGMPDGGALFSRSPPPPPQGQREPGLMRIALLHRRWLAQQSGLAASLQSEAARRAHEYSERPELDFAPGDLEEPASAATRYLVSRLAATGAAERRRQNFVALADTLANRIVAPFRELPSGASPLAFPIRAPKKARLLEQLLNAGVIEGKGWEVPHPLLPSAGFPAADELRRTLVALPVHQELAPRHLDRIAQVVERSLSD